MYYIFRVKSPINLSLKNLAAFCEFVARCNIMAAADYDDGGNSLRTCVYVCGFFWWSQLLPPKQPTYTMNNVISNWYNVQHYY